MSRYYINHSDGTSESSIGDIVSELMRYLPKCGKCNKPAIWKQTSLLIIGDVYLCDKHNSPTTSIELAEADLVKACEELLSRYPVR